MYGIAFVVMALAAALTAGLFRIAGQEIALRDLGIVTIAITIALEGSLLAMRALKGTDQAAAVQAGMSGMVLLMLLSLGLLGACLMMRVVSSDAAIRYSPLLFLTALVLAAYGAIRTIRSAPAGGAAAVKVDTTKAK